MSETSSGNPCLLCRLRFRGSGRLEADLLFKFRSPCNLLHDHRAFLPALVEHLAMQALVAFIRIDVAFRVDGLSAPARARPSGGSRRRRCVRRSQQTVNQTPPQLQCVRIVELRINSAYNPAMKKFWFSTPVFVAIVSLCTAGMIWLQQTPAIALILIFLAFYVQTKMRMHEDCKVR